MTALTLKIIACIAMLIDHIGYIINFIPFRIVGRIAFLIYLYLICNGYRHTSNCLHYALRLLGFALVSQIPFSLFCYNTAWSGNGNVFFTLLLALLCIWSADSMMKKKILRWFSLLPSILVFVLYHYGVIQSDYGARAILLAMVFFLFDGNKVVNRIFLCIGYLFGTFYAPILSVILHFIQGDMGNIPSISEWSLVQAWSAMALPLIFTYNGEKGVLPRGKVASKLLQYGFYAFYPCHLLLLWVIRIA